MSKNRIYRRYRTKWLVPLKRYENAFFKKIYAIFRAETRYISQEYVSNISINGLSIVREIELKKNIENAMQRMVKDVIPFAAALTEKEIEREFKQDDFAYIKYIQAYLGSDFFSDSVSQIVSTYYDDIKKVIQDGIAEEQTREQIAKTIAVRMPSISDYRAKTIAITETHRASSYASESRAKDMSQELGVVMLKDWIPVSDSRTRNTHSAMASAEPIPIDQMFTVGGEKMSRPGDPRGSAANTIRCRCIMRYIPEE